MRVSRSGAVRSAMRPHSNAAAQPLLQGEDRLGRPVGREDDLLAVLVDRIERVEELFLGAFLVRDELDVVDEQQVDPAVARPEVVDLALLDAGDELVGELLAGGVDHALARELRDDRVADGVHQVGLAEAHAAVQEQRVVRVARALGHRQRGRVGEPVRRAHDEVRERVARVEVGRATLRRPDPRGLHPDGRARRGRGGGLGLAVGADGELDLDAVADDLGQRLGDQGPVSPLQPVLREAVRDGDPEALVVHLHEMRVTQPRLVVGRGQGDLELAEGGAPDLLGVHQLRCDPGLGVRGWIGLVGSER